MKKGACYIDKVEAVTILLNGAEYGNIESLVPSVLRLKQTKSN